MGKFVSLDDKRRRAESREYYRIRSATEKVLNQKAFVLERAILLGILIHSKPKAPDTLRWDHSIWMNLSFACGHTRDYAVVDH